MRMQGEKLRNRTAKEQPFSGLRPDTRATTAVSRMKNQKSFLPLLITHVHARAVPEPPAHAPLNREPSAPPKHDGKTERPPHGAKAGAASPSRPSGCPFRMGGVQSRIQWGLPCSLREAFASPWKNLHEGPRPQGELSPEITFYGLWIGRDRLLMTANLFLSS